ncbi:hypothetical protein NDU88_002218 [Pleurodeles waltl]|uniref:Uncharacterized protein n=1 Tax=Pleurodeles waltl TaxID=8319 RepID=A0AAV7U8S8_PLEWA|nr:hypothetical protein NDU88_002218 [Pleurodeles waltl]
MPVPDRSEAKWRVGPVFEVVLEENQPMPAGPAGSGVHHTSGRSDRVPHPGRDRAPLDDAPQGTRRASLAPRDSGKQSPVAHIHRVHRLGRGDVLGSSAPQDARRALRFPGKEDPVGATTEK